MEERSIPILGEETIKTLNHLHIAIFGLGGVGGYVVEALARQGVGQFSVFDCDVFDETNKNRQILALESTIGKKKVVVCAERIKDINPNAIVHSYDLRIDETTIETIDFSSFDYVVDCIDDFKGKIAIIKAAKLLGKKIISCCGTANKINPMKFVIQDISKTSVCPLAKKLRYELKKLDIKDVDVLYSLESPRISNFEALPSVSYVPSVAGLLIAKHVIEDVWKKVKGNRIHLVLEGGGMKCVYTAGVLDFFLDQNINFDAVYGVSGGACTGASFLSKQRERGYHAMVDYLDNPDCVSKKSLRKTGNYFNKEFVYYQIPDHLIPFDYEVAHQNPCKLYATVTNVETGRAEYHPCLDYHKDIEYICASSSLPLLAQIQEIEGKKFLDGGITDSIPILEAQKNARKCVVVLTKPNGYLCQKQNVFLFKAIRLKYRKYPKLIKALERRHLEYNRSLKILQQDSNVFIIRPSKALEIDRLEKDRSKLKDAYLLGYHDAECQFEQLKEFMKK